MFRDAGLPALADVARLARTWRCGRGALLCRAGEASRELLVLAAGAAEVFTRRDKRDARSARIGPHALLDADALVVGSAHKISVRVSSAAAYVLTINGERLRALMERNASLSLTMFGAVAAAAAPEITAPPEIAVHV
jgi:CRP-like cAMP-binding protein